MNLSALFTVALLACSDKEGGSQGDDSALPPDSESPGDSGDSEGSPGGDDSGEEPEPPVDLAADLGLTERAFDPSGSSGDFGQVAPDFTWQTLDGPWNLQENWTGYDTYVLVNYYPKYDYPVELTDPSDVAEWLTGSPYNARWFFFSIETDEEAIQAELEAVRGQIEAALDEIDPDLASHWEGRIHYVTDSAWSADWVGALNNQYYEANVYIQWALAIDRFQVVRETGYFCDPSTGWATCPPRFLRYEPEYFNFESDRQDQLDAEGEVTVVRAFDREPVSDPSWVGQRSYAEVALPGDMSGFDTLALDLTLECAAYPGLVNCPAWDYIASAYLCEEDDPLTLEDESESCNTEIGRWITTYWRPGRWIIDATPFLALLQSGGTRRIAFYTQQYYNVTLDLRLSNQGVGVRPVALVPLYHGGTFNEFYNWGASHEIGASSWVAWTDPAEPMSWEIAQRDDEAGWLVAQNGSDQPISRGMWSRFDWEISEGSLYLCRTVSAESDEEDAIAATYTCEEDDPKTKEDESLNCTGANHDDLVSGCNGGGWRVLKPSDDRDPLGIDGLWTETWHEDKLPITFTPPPDAARVGIASVVSGHGFTNTREQCAEFCDHQHRFTVNDSASYTKEHPEADDWDGCADRVAQGVVPNQAGTWIYGRAAWCPGWEVRPWVLDITGDVTLGAENTVSYHGLFEGSVNYGPNYNSGYSWTDAYILLDSYLVYYE